MTVKGTWNFIAYDELVHGTRYVSIVEADAFFIAFCDEIGSDDDRIGLHSSWSRADHDHVTMMAATPF